MVLIRKLKLKNFKKNNYENNDGINKPSRPASNYLCTHCNISRHTIERCFKIHGYPSGFQTKFNRKVVALSHQVSTKVQTNNVEEEIHTVTASQYNQLMNLLQKNSETNNAGTSAKHAY